MVKIWPGKGHTAYGKFFERVLKRWGKNIKSYSEKYDGDDQLYRYNENATVSTLAQAISQVGKNVHLLQDFRIQKKERTPKKGNAKKKAKVVNGRADLWFECDDLPQGFLIEVKPSWPTLKKLDTDSFFSKVKSSFKKNYQRAETDIKKCRSSCKKMECTGMAIVFIAPRIRRSDLAEAPAILESLLERLNKMEESEFSSICMFASVFPKEGMKALGDSGYVYPGVILLGGEVLNS